MATVIEHCGRAAVELDGTIYFLDRRWDHRIGEEGQFRAVDGDQFANEVECEVVEVPPSRENQKGSEIRRPRL